MREMNDEEWAAYCESEEASFEWGTIIGTFIVDEDAGPHQYTVWIDPDNRSVPHFHVFDELGYRRNATHKDGVHTCIEIRSGKYFRHEPYMDRLGPQALMALDRFMRQVREGNKSDAGLTNFRHTILAWNENNTEYREDSPYYVDPNSTSQPDYAEGMIVRFTLGFLDRVLAQERELRPWFAAVKSNEEWFDHIPRDVFEEDRPAAYLLHRSLHGVSRLEPSAIKRLFKEGAFGTLIVAAREQGMNADALNALLMAQGASGRSCAIQGFERIPVRQRRLSASDFPCDAYGHNPRWYAQLFKHIRHRYASDYRRMGTILKQAGCPRPIKTDTEGLSVEEYARSVLPKRVEYLAIDISKGATATEFHVAYLDRAAGEKLAHDDDKSDVLLFRMIDGGPHGCDAYIGVFTVTCGQMAHIVGDMKRSDPLRQDHFSVDVEACLQPARRNLPWTPKEPRFDALGLDAILASLRMKTRIASFDIPDSALWQRACRAGTTSRYNNGSDREEDCRELGWTAANSCLKLHPVGLKRPNAYGLYDMHGNVGECCWRRHGQDQVYVYRGGSFLSVTWECKSNSVREDMGSANQMGIRLAIYL